eukprot:scaffold319_cov362-Pavlova_lutheri.AAC.28
MKVGVQWSFVWLVFLCPPPTARTDGIPRCPAFLNVFSMLRCSILHVPLYVSCPSFSLYPGASTHCRGSHTDHPPEIHPLSAFLSCESTPVGCEGRWTSRHPSMAVSGAC